MKDLMSLVAICKADLDRLGIKYGRVSNWTVNTRAKCRLGQCRKMAAGLFDINIYMGLIFSCSLVKIPFFFINFLLY